VDQDPDTEETQRARLILGLRSQGVTDAKVLDALEKTPRDLFVPDLFQDRTWEDSALPIACGQTISQPFIVGLMTQALRLESRSRVLEIGTGSGYQTAVLSRLARYVYTVERYRTLMGEAERRFRQLDLLNVMVTAAAPSEPKILLSQLKPRGTLVAPIGRGAVQTLTRYTGDGEGGFSIEALCEVRFVPLLDGVAKEL
jgi:protein-L-isoaspartate(D-aspartate) O-methyltransferase